jgi:hypothetical protein
MNPGPQVDYAELPEHVRRIIERDGELEFTPPSFERWIGRLQMLRTIASLAAFSFVWLVSYTSSGSWETATVHGIIAAIAFHFFAWTAGLFVFGELYDIEVKQARRELEERERERARRIEEYYRERLRAQQAVGADGVEPVPGGAVPSLGSDPLTVVEGYHPTSQDVSSRLAA